MYLDWQTTIPSYEVLPFQSILALTERRIQATDTDFVLALLVRSLSLFLYDQVKFSYT